MTSPEHSSPESGPQVETSTEVDIDRTSIAYRLGRLAGRAVRSTINMRNRAIGYEGRPQLPELTESDLEAREANATEMDNLAESAMHALRVQLESPSIGAALWSEQQVFPGDSIKEDHTELAGNTFRRVANAMIARLELDHGGKVIQHGEVAAVMRDSSDPLGGDRLTKVRNHVQTLLATRTLFGSDPKVINGSLHEDPRSAGLDSMELAMQLAEMVAVLERDRQHHTRPESVTWNMDKEQLHALAGLASVGAEIARADNDPEVILAWRDYFTSGEDGQVISTDMFDTNGE